MSTLQNSESNRSGFGGLPGEAAARGWLREVALAACGDRAPARQLAGCCWLPGFGCVCFEAAGSRPVYLRQRGEELLQVLIACKFLVINHCSFF